MIIEERWKELASVSLLHGSHASRADGVWAMEAVAWLAGEKHGDAPECTCPVIAAFVRRWDDRIKTDEDRTRLLRPLIPKLIGTRSTKAVEQKRALLIMDWLIRENTP